MDFGNFETFQRGYIRYSKTICEALPGVLFSRGKMAFISGEHAWEQGNKDIIGEQGRETHKKKQIFAFFWVGGGGEVGEQGNKLIYLRGTRDKYP